MNERLSLTELQLIIKDSLYMALPDLYWVIAEISEFKENYNGHCYLELVEKHPDETSIRARIKALIWSNRYRFIKSFFENSTGETLRDGLKILIRAKIEYHEVYGLSLVINDIDPAYTIGEMALKRQQILKKLEDEGIITMNKELSFPVVPQRIAVISSANAAGYTDFLNHLKGNSFGYMFYTALFETPMQGKDTESGCIRSLDKIASHLDKFDLVVIIRGGGSQTDLSWFDNYNIAYYITQFPLPVITGIGHEKDLSVSDIVAFRSLKTPTAVADFLIECMNKAETRIIDISTEITNRSMLMVEETRKRIETELSRLIPAAKFMISDFKELLSGVMIDMINTGKDFVLRAGTKPENQILRLSSGAGALLIKSGTGLHHNKETLANDIKNLLYIINNRLAGLNNSLTILDPENVLRRGYTITTMNGRIIKTGKQLAKDDIIDTRFSDISVSSKVIKNESGP